MSFRLGFLLNYDVKVVLKVLGMIDIEVENFGKILGKVWRLEMVEIMGSKGRVAALF